MSYSSSTCFRETVLIGLEDTFNELNKPEYEQYVLYFQNKILPFLSENVSRITNKVISASKSDMSVEKKVELLLQPTGGDIDICLNLLYATIYFLALSWLCGFLFFLIITLPIAVIASILFGICFYLTLICTSIVIVF